MNGTELTHDYTRKQGVISKEIFLPDHAPKEYKSLKEKISSHTEIMINKLSRYMKNSGKTYQNYYATILNWYEEDKEKLKHQGGNKKMKYDVGESL